MQLSESEKRDISPAKLVLSTNSQLPEGWIKKPLQGIVEMAFSGVNKKSRSDQKTVRLCNYMDVYNNDYITADIDFMPATASDREIEKFTLQQGDVIITKDSETPDDIGVSAVVLDDLDNVICGYHLALLRPNQNEIDGIFLAKELARDRVSHQFSRVANGATRFGLTTDAVQNIKVNVPPLPEQKKIARILGTWDQAIDLTERLIEVKERQKQGFMQQLLPGSARLSDSDNPQNTSFGKLSKEWNTVEFGNIATLSVRKFDPKKEESNFDCIELEHIDQGTGRLLGVINSSTQASTKNVFQKGQVLFGKLRPYLKKYWLATFEGVCSSEIWVLEGKPDICINEFLYYLIQSHRFSQAANVTSGSKMPRADWDYLSNTAFFLPALPEQHKIVAVLSACDREIELLSRKVDALKEQKKGLMQQLLTGKVRVKI